MKKGTTISRSCKKGMEHRGSGDQNVCGYAETESCQGRVEGIE